MLIHTLIQSNSLIEDMREIRDGYDLTPLAYHKLACDVTNVLNAMVRLGGYDYNSPEGYKVDEQLRAARIERDKAVEIL